MTQITNQRNWHLLIGSELREDTDVRQILTFMAAAPTIAAGLRTRSDNKWFVYGEEAHFAKN